MASIRQKRPGYWEVRVFVGYDDAGRHVQVSKVVKGSKRDAERLAAQLASRPATRSGSLTVAELLDEYVEHKAASWSPGGPDPLGRPNAWCCRRRRRAIGGPCRSIP